MNCDLWWSSKNLYINVQGTCNKYYGGKGGTSNKLKYGLSHWFPKNKYTQNIPFMSNMPEKEVIEDICWKSWMWNIDQELGEFYVLIKWIIY